MPRIKFYTTEQAAEMLAVNRAAVTRMIQRGHIKAVNINDGVGQQARYRISENELLRFIDERTFDAAS